MRFNSPGQHGDSSAAALRQATIRSQGPSRCHDLAAAASSDMS